MLSTCTIQMLGVALPIDKMLFSFREVRSAGMANTALRTEDFTAQVKVASFESLCQAFSRVYFKLAQYMLEQQTY